MDLSQWEGLSGELADFLLENAPQKLANPNIAGFSWDAKTTKQVLASYLSTVEHRAIRNASAEPASSYLRSYMRSEVPARLHAIWIAPPQPAAENPRRWWNFVATSGVSGRARGDRWKQLLGVLREMLIFSPEDLAQLGAH